MTFQKDCLVFLLLLALNPFIVNGQTVNKDTIKEKKSFLAAYPFIFYLPETRLGFGGAGVYTYFPGKQKSDRASLWQLGAAYTLNKQILLYASYQLFLRQNRTELSGEIGYYDYVYPYYGLGNNTIFEKEEKYYASFPRINITYLERLNKYFRAGLLVKFDNFNISKIEDGGLLALENPIARTGGMVLNTGAVLRYDSRDHIFQPTKGLYATLELLSTSKALGNKFPYRELNLNIAGYYLLKKKHILAYQVVLGLQYGEVPFYKLMNLGGPKMNRGIIEGRFRDKNRILGQIEYRFPISKRFAGVAFVSAGRVDSKLDQLFQSTFHYNYGAGLRFVLDKENQLRMRLDIGLGSDKPAFYLTVGEAF